jgi:hypothetical protein
MRSGGTGHPGQQGGKGRLADIAGKGQQAEKIAGSAPDIGGADVAAAGCTDIDAVQVAGQQQAAGDGARQIGEQQQEYEKGYGNHEGVLSNRIPGCQKIPGSATGSAYGFPVSWT